MGVLTEEAQFPETVPKFETSTILVGGGDQAPMNAPLKALADRTQYLKQQADAVGLPPSLYLIPEGTTVTVPEGSNFFIANGIVIDGELVVFGRVIEVL